VLSAELHLGNRTRVQIRARHRGHPALVQASCGTWTRGSDVGRRGRRPSQRTKDEDGANAGRPAERGVRRAETDAVAAYLTALRAPKVPARSRAALEKRRAQIEEWLRSPIGPTSKSTAACPTSIASETRGRRYSSTRCRQAADSAAPGYRWPDLVQTCEPMRSVAAKPATTPGHASRRGAPARHPAAFSRSTSGEQRD
jgi:hypothetical protein